MSPETTAERDELDDAITFTPVGDGRSTRVDLWQDDRSASGCWIVRQRIRVGRSVVRMDGIGGVGTEPERRRQGFASRVLHAAIRRMKAGDAALSMLYGIPDFYERFGYTQAGPEHAVYVDPDPEAEPPAGWSLRPAMPEDVPALRAVYEEATNGAVGAAVRNEDAHVWRALSGRLAEGASVECAVAVGPNGKIGGYVRKGEGFWAVEVLARDEPTCTVFGEAHAIGPEAADAVLTHCVRSTRCVDGEQQPVLLPIPHDGAVAHAAMLRRARFVRAFSPSGGSMALVLDGARLLQSIAEELAARLRSVRLRLLRPLEVLVDDEPLTMRMARGKLLFEKDSASGAGAGTPTDLWRTSHSDLAKLALGALPPEDVLCRSCHACSERVQTLVCALFPERCAHMYLPDRF